jgi:hypothetical protein
MAYPTDCCGSTISTQIICGNFEAPLVEDQGACFPYRLFRSCEAPTITVRDEVAVIVWDALGSPIFILSQP